MTLNEMTDTIRQRFNNPDSPNLSKVLKIVNLEDSPHVAWNNLTESGILPDGFIHDNRRKFGDHEEGKLIYPDDRPLEHSKPPSLVSVVTTASDPSGILQAEGFARELAQRLVPFKGASNDEIVWYFTKKPYRNHPYETTFMGMSLESPRMSLELTLRNLGIELKSFWPKEGCTPHLPLFVCECIAAWEGWRIAIDRDIEENQGSALWPFDETGWRRYALLENPFEPLLNLWSTGYRICCDFKEDDPTIRLYAKPIEKNTITSILNEHR